MARILVIEDEADLRDMLRANLTREGFEVEVHADGQPGLDAHAQKPADLLVLDLMLPGLDGFQVLRALRSRRDPLPVLMLTARGEEDARLNGFALGADDYLVKPFSVLELIGRVRAILRRSRPAISHLPTSLVSGPFRMDLARMALYRGPQRLELGARGLRVLEVLWRRPQKTLARMEILTSAWEPDARPGVRTVDVHIGVIRRELGEGEGFIATVDGIGYQWTRPVA